MTSPTTICRETPSSAPRAAAGDGAGGGAEAFEDRLPPSGRVHETSLDSRLYGDRNTDPAPRGAPGDTPT